MYRCESRLDITRTDFRAYRNPATWLYRSPRIDLRLCEKHAQYVSSDKPNRKDRQGRDYLEPGIVHKGHDGNCWVVPLPRPPVPEVVSEVAS